MDLDTTQRFAERVMQHYGLRAWTFHYSKSKRRFGECNYTFRRIEMSKALVLLNSFEQIRNTLFHEIAHALMPGHGHDFKWRVMAQSLGCDGKMCYDPAKVVMPKAKYLLKCSQCLRTWPRHKKLKYAPEQYQCPRCRVGLQLEVSK